MIRLFLILSVLLTSSAQAVTLLEALEDPRISRDVRLPMGGPSHEPSVPAEVISLGRRVAPHLQQIRLGRKVYSWDVASPRDRMPNYCSDQCACIARELQPVVHALNYPVRKLTLRPAFRQAFEVKLRDHAGRERRYDFHQVLVVKIAGRWRVIDPLILGNTVPERLSAWLNRIDQRQTKVIDIF